MVDEKPLKIAQVVAVFPPYRGGLGTVAAEYFRSLTAVGDSVTVFTPDYARHSTLKWGKAAIMVSLLWRLRSFDVIHLHYPFYGSDLLVVLASLIWRTSLVITYHMTAQASGLLGLIFRLHRVLIEPLILWRASQILVSSSEYGRRARLSEHKMMVMPFGVDTIRFTPGRDDTFRTTHNIDVDATAILFVGGLDANHYFKGLDVLLRALSNLVDDPSWQLVVVGSGALQSTFVEQADKLGLAHRVHFIGSVPFADLPRAYRAADLHVLPSINSSEAFGIVTIEAAASGLPSIVTDLPGVRSVVIPNETGLIVAPNDAPALAHALRELLASDGRRELMGAAARVRAQKEYCANTLIESLRTVYRSLL